jgi:ABC-type thiamin/hydroxymethylpyrimidine transport system permease subunit
MSGGPLFRCAPGAETLAAELAELVDGSWELASGVDGVMIMATGAAVPRELPEGASETALAWWQRSVSTVLAPANRPRASV